VIDKERRGQRLGEFHQPAPPLRRRTWCLWAGPQQGEAIRRHRHLSRDPPLESESQGRRRRRRRRRRPAYWPSSRPHCRSGSRRCSSGPHNGFRRCRRCRRRRSPSLAACSSALRVALALASPTAQPPLGPVGRDLAVVCLRRRQLPTLAALAGRRLGPRAVLGG
jgi:hypothetical protein